MDRFIEKAFGMQQGDIEWAKSQRDRYPLVEEVDGRGDAASHLALGWISSRSQNPKASLKAANLREYVTGLASYSRKMDISNNNLGSKIKAKTFEEAEKEIDRLIKSGEAKYYTPSESDKLFAEAYGIIPRKRKSRPLID
jgi:hypothetical protein